MKVYLITFEEPESQNFVLKKVSSRSGKEIIKERINSSSDFVSKFFGSSLFSSSPALYVFEGLGDIKDRGELEEIIITIEKYQGEVVFLVADIYQKFYGEKSTNRSKTVPLKSLYDRIFSLAELLPKPSWDEVVGNYIKENHIEIPQRLLELLRSYTSESPTEAIKVLEAIRNFGRTPAEEDIYLFFAGEPDPEFSNVAKSLLKRDRSILPQLEELSRRERTDSLILSLYKYALYAGFPKNRRDITFPSVTVAALLKALSRADTRAKTSDEVLAKEGFLLDVFRFLFKL